ncbi:hypothetical protein Mgra_00001753 [Meloidogyne graminicola]|uniref:Uncharacterized protein n=1 Tax=Meloidogyne graminicola TaxID=189291 RepID=A0A8S9ZYB1_9BILA|nr:hypothetical protein Mgra_00001753 [Meloidogyne graminicola]
MSSADSTSGQKTRTQRLRGRDFYHGMIQRADVNELLVKNG